MVQISHVFELFNVLGLADLNTRKCRLCDVVLVFDFVKYLASIDGFSNRQPLAFTIMTCFDFQHFRYSMDQ